MIYLLLKADHPPIPPGSRWITVHPPGHEKGQPILVTPHPTHKGVWSVIGGAGGKLNYLKIRGLKEPGEYRARAAEQAQAKKALEKQQKERDKELGITEIKGEKRGQLLEQKRKAQQEFVKVVAEKAGWKPQDYEFDAEKYKDLSPDAYKKVLGQHQRDVMDRAKDYVNLQRESLLADTDRRAQAIAELPITAQIETALTVDDLTRTKAPDAGIGISHEYGERAAAKAGDAQKLKEEIEQKFPKPVDEDREAKTEERKISHEAIKAEIAKVAPPPVPEKDPHAADLDVRQTLDLLAAEKALKQQERETSKALKKLAGLEDQKEIQAYNIKTTRLPPDESILQDLQDIARTEQTAQFLQMAQKAGEGIPPEQALYRHISAGASNALSGVGLTVAGEALVDRSVIDVLGMSGAARAMADRLRATLPPDQLTEVQQALEDYHVDHYTNLAREAMDKAQVWLDIADHAESMDSVEDGNEIAITENLNAQRIEALAEARRILGTALGEFEMGAALNWAMQEGPTTIPHEVSMGKTSPADAYVRLRAIGLEPEDIDLQDIGGEVFASISPEGMKRVSSPIDPATLQRQKNAMEVIDGKYDDPDWIPEGFAPRKDLNGVADPGQAPKLAEPFNASAGIEQGIKDYFGGRVADGDNPRDIMADALNNQWMETYVEDKTAFIEAINTLLPPARQRKAMVDGVEKTLTESVPIEQYRATLEQWADDFAKNRYGTARQPFDKQEVPIDEVSTEAMHRALSAHPAGYAAFKPIADLNPRDQKALRDYFQSFVARDQGDAQELKTEIQKLQGNEPVKEVESMFGDMDTNPEWTNWNNRLTQSQQKLNEQTLTWDRYVTVMDGRPQAYAAIQDLIRSKVVDTFATSYNTLRKDQPLVVGRQNIREHLRHRDALDPKHRAQRLSEESKEAAKMRKREGGKFAAGRISEEREERRIASEGFAQAQIGLIGDDPADTTPAPLGEHERYSLGHVGEQRIAALATRIGEAFDAKQPVELRSTSLSGKYINQQRAIKLIAANKRVALAQGVGCVHGNTRLTCESTGKTRTFMEWFITRDRPFVKAISGHGEIVIAEASPVFIKGYEEMFDVVVGNEKITVTHKHLFLTPMGWKELGNLKTGDLIFTEPTGLSHQDLAAEPQGDPERLAGALESMADNASEQRLSFACHQESSSELYPPTLHADDLHCTNKELNCSGHYFGGPHQYDEQPPNDSIASLMFETSPVDARVYTRYGLNLDGLACGEGHNHSCPEYAHPSKTDSDLRILPHTDADQYDALSSTNEPPHLRNPNDAQFQPYSFYDPDKDHSHEPGLGYDTDMPASSCTIQRIEPRSPPSDGSNLSGEQSQQSNGTLQISKLLTDNHISCWKPIQKITSSGNSIVFDIRVPVHDCYFAEGILNHNSGKTSIGLGAFTHLHAEGKVKRGLFAVPSIVQGQFNTEALRLLDPNKGYQWHAHPGSDREERIKALKDPANHFCVMTHQSLRDDILHLASQHEQLPPEDFTKKFMGMLPKDRAQYMSELMKREGIDVQYLNVDEGHNLLNREGKQESIMAAVFDSISVNTPYYVNATADPVKNDVSEAHDLMKKMNPERYADRGEFMRRYAPNTTSAKDALRREMLQHLYPGRIDPGVAAKRIEEKIELDPGQKSSINRIEEAAAKVRLARMKGTVDVESAKVLSPEAFQDADPKDYEKIATEMARYIGITKNQSILRAINNTPSSVKVQRVQDLVAARKGKPGVIFAHNLKSVEMLKQRLEKEGHRVVVLTGADSSKRKNEIKRAFSPEGEEAATADILIASDAGATGMNAQRGQWLIQYDCPETAMVHAQRNGRIHRLGQKNNVELIDMMTNHPAEIAARKRLAEKYELREIMTSPYEGLDDTGLAKFLHRRKVDPAPPL